MPIVHSLSAVAPFSVALFLSMTSMAAPVARGPIVSDAIVSDTHRERPHCRRTHRPWPYCPQPYHQRCPSSAMSIVRDAHHPRCPSSPILIVPSAHRSRYPILANLSSSAPSSTTPSSTTPIIRDAHHQPRTSSMAPGSIVSGPIVGIPSDSEGTVCSFHKLETRFFSLSDPYLVLLDN